MHHIFTLIVQDPKYDRSVVLKPTNLFSDFDLGVSCVVVIDVWVKLA